MPGGHEAFLYKKCLGSELLEISVAQGVCGSSLILGPEAQEEQCIYAQNNRGKGECTRISAFQSLGFGMASDFGITTS
jgi:hypothetical protein